MYVSCPKTLTLTGIYLLVPVSVAKFIFEYTFYQLIEPTNTSSTCTRPL
eukprot:SAG31_NODE_30429_length_381_cov_0.918440_1_plen_48_part_10